MNKKSLTKADIRTKFITPAIEAAGWGSASWKRCSTTGRAYAETFEGITHPNMGGK